MRKRFEPTGRVALLLSMVAFTLALGSGCASIKVTDRDEYRGKKLARPDQILVHDFAATADDLPDWSDAAKTYADAGAEATESELEAGRKLGVEMTSSLVERIRAMGLNAERATATSQPSEGDIVIVGYLASVEEGSGFKRVVIGFGSGAAEVTSHVEGYLATAEGLRKLGSGGTTSGPGRSPGVVVPLIVTVATANPIGLLVTLPVKVGSEMTGGSTVEGVGKKMADKIADVLEEKFREQGWLDR